MALMRIVMNLFFELFLSPRNCKIISEIVPGPGSSIEVLKILPLLTQRDGSGPSFHIVAPSLPSFGFSRGVSKCGFALAQYAETCHKLNHQLGYNQYVTQAGDWGFWITRTIGKLYLESCRASHMSMIYANPPTFGRNPLLALQHLLSPYSPSEKQGLERTDWFHKESRGKPLIPHTPYEQLNNTRTGYNVLQSTKPQTISYALQDSPIALLSWIYEKLHDWSDSYPWTDDEILTWISIYQFSRAGPGDAHRIYYEVMHDTRFPYEKLLEYTPEVKLGMTYKPKDLDIFPRAYGKTLGDVVFEAENERGG
jgi:pimeloyl-ACP methyl ester carboxylesterase